MTTRLRFRHTTGVQILYVYAVTRRGNVPDVESIDGTNNFGSVAEERIAAVYTPVAAAQFSQEAIDSRAGDLEWIGAIGYHHQEVVTDLLRGGAIVPLRAFTLFSGEEALLAFLRDNTEMLEGMLERLAGKREWTLRIEFDPERWSRALGKRLPSIAALEAELKDATPGRAFLLRKKLEDETRRGSREAEQQIVAEIEEAVAARLSCETVAETRQSRDGAFPQIDVLLAEDEEARLRDLQDELAPRYEAEGVVLAVSGPWPPYTFAAMQK